MKRVAALALVGAALTVRAVVTNDVDIAALVAASTSGVSETNGWKVSSKLDAYADSSLRFSEWADEIVSPDYGAPIVGIEATVRCSSASPTRTLAVFDVADSSAVWPFAKCPVVESLRRQEVRIDSACQVSCIRVALDSAGSGSTGWGIGSLKVITADPVAEPSNLCVPRNGAGWCALSWKNGEGTVSNRVDTILVERSEEGETVLLSTGFDTFSAGGNTESKTNELAKIDAALSGVRIYAPANTTGICQVAIGTASGCLRHSGFADYSGVSLKLVLKRYPGDNAGMQVAYEVDGEIKLYGKKIELPEEFEERIVDLADVPGGAAILIGYDTVASKRRVLIDSLEIVRKGAETKTIIDSRWIPASPGEAEFSTEDCGIELVPKSEYRFEVRAQNKDGIVSSATTLSMVLDIPLGFRFILR